ncbi:hypothetical protein GQ53DRAFT_504793 [Thozetella sp. PMI_491]|nr:hypothetical protein GQ53DRAFT_504793 [Thozetella sp. PMI_491]
MKMQAGEVPESEATAEDTMGYIPRLMAPAVLFREAAQVDGRARRFRPCFTSRNPSGAEIRGPFARLNSDANTRLDTVKVQDRRFRPRMTAWPDLNFFVPCRMALGSSAKVLVARPGKTKGGVAILYAHLSVASKANDGSLARGTRSATSRRSWEPLARKKNISGLLCGDFVRLCVEMGLGV